MFLGNDYEALKFTKQIIYAKNRIPFDLGLRQECGYLENFLKWKFPNIVLIYQCDECNASKEDGSACNGCPCKFAFYCSRACQRKHWKIHKYICKIKNSERDQ